MTAGTLAFVGGRPFSDGCDFDQDLATVAGSDRVAIIPTAAAYEHPERLLEAAASHFAALNIEVDPIMVLRRGDALDATLAAQVEAARFIYLVGESPMHLWSVMKNSPVWDAVVAAHQSGATLAGSSAGARILGDPMVDPRGGAFTVGLGVCPDFAVIPHHSDWSRERSERTLKMAPAGLPLVAIDEATAVIRSPDGTWTIRGAGTAIVYRDLQVVGLDVLP